MTKQELRKTYLRKRQALSEAEYLHLNHILCETFFSSIDLSFIRVVHTFLPLIEKHEPDTWLIIDRIRREFPHIRLSIPRVNPMTFELENFYFEGLHQLQTNAWGISEPKQGIPASAEKIDLVLVPLLAFDRKGNRVGYGKGYYDKFLATCKESCITIGLSHFAPEDLIDDMNEDDVPIKRALTPGGIYYFQTSGSC
jgi:5-formyltetrahydrofolate cyclo-ligase